MGIYELTYSLLTPEGNINGLQTFMNYGLQTLMGPQSFMNYGLKILMGLQAFMIYGLQIVMGTANLYELWAANINSQSASRDN